MAGFSVKTFLFYIGGSGALGWVLLELFARRLADRWFIRYRSQLDKDMESYKDTLERRRKQIDAELGHRTHIFKTQFEAEYNALRDCFAALGKLRLSFNALRPFMDSLPEGKQDRLELVVSRVHHTTERYDSFVDTFESVYPFISQDIYERFEACSKAVFLEIRHIEENTDKALLPSGYIEADKQRERFNEAYFAAAKLVRERFKSLAIVSDRDF